MTSIGKVSIVKSHPISFDINVEENMISCLVVPSYQTGIEVVDEENSASTTLASELRNLLWNSLFNEAKREIRLTISTKQDRTPCNQEIEMQVTGSFIAQCVHLVGKANLNGIQVILEDMERSGKSLQAMSNPTSSDYSEKLTIDLPKWSEDKTNGTFSGSFSYVDTIFNVFYWHDYTSYQGKLTVNFFANVQALELQPLVSCREFQRKLLVEQHETDIIIEADDGFTVGCHKVFLTGQSKVFKKMLDEKAQESEAPRTIHIRDMTSTGVKALLNFLYHITFDPTLCPFATAMELLHASDKYGIDRLKVALITGFMQKPLNTIKIEDALQLFYITRNVQGFDELKGKAAQVLKSHIKKLIHMDEYKKLFTENPQLAMELCSAIFVAKC